MDDETGNRTYNMFRHKCLRRVDIIQYKWNIKSGKIIVSTWWRHLCPDIRGLMLGCWQKEKGTRFLPFSFRQHPSIKVTWVKWLYVAWKKRTSSKIRTFCPVLSNWKAFSLISCVFWIWRRSGLKLEIKSTRQFDNKVLDSKCLPWPLLPFGERSGFLGSSTFWGSYAKQLVS